MHQRMGVSVSGWLIVFGFLWWTSIIWHHMTLGSEQGQFDSADSRISAVSWVIAFSGLYVEQCQLAFTHSSISVVSWFVVFSGFYVEQGKLNATDARTSVAKWIIGMSGLLKPNKFMLRFRFWMGHCFLRVVNSNADFFCFFLRLQCYAVRYYTL